MFGIPSFKGNVIKEINTEQHATAQAINAVRKALQLQHMARVALEKQNIPQYSAYRTDVYNVLGVAVQAAHKINIEASKLRKQTPGSITNQECRMVHDIISRILDARNYTAGREMNIIEARKKGVAVENKLRFILNEENILLGIERKLRGKIR
jgi:hypothetical protein